MSPIPAGPISLTVQADLSGTAYGGTPTWTDLSAKVPSGAGFPAVSITKWRQDQVSDPTPTQVTLPLVNTDGRFTPGRATLVGGGANPYYPNVRRRVRLQVNGTVASTPVYFGDVFADSWEVGRDSSGVWLSTFSGTDILGRMGADTPLRAAVIEEMIFSGAASIYPLDEPDGAVTAGDITGNAPAATMVTSKYGAGTAPLFGFATTMIGTTGSLVLASPDAGTSAAHAHATWLSVPSAFDVNLSFGFTVEMWVQPSTNKPATTPERIFTLGNDAYAEVATNGNLTVWIEGQTLTFANDYTDGAWHHIVVTMDTYAGVYAAYVDAVEQSVTVPGGGLWQPTGQPLTVGVNPQGPTRPWDGAVALVAQYTGALIPARVLDHYNAGANGFADVGGFGAETADMRIARFLRYRTNLGSSLDLGDMVMGPAQTAGQTLQQAILEAAQAEGGFVYADGQGQIVLRARVVNYDPVSLLTLDCNSQAVSLPTTFRDDIQFMLNDVTVTRPGGASQRAVDQASVTADGEAATSLELNLGSDWAALQLAGWMVAVGRREWVGVPSLTVDLKQVGSAVVLALCQLQPLDVVTLENLPDPWPSSSMTLQVQGIQFSLAADAQSAVLFCSPVPPLILRADATPDAYTKLDAGLVIAA